MPEATHNVYAKYENKSAREKRNQLLQFPRSHAFVIGINHYPDISAHLTSAVPDAERMAAVLWDEQGFDQVWLLRDIRGAEFRKFLEWIGKKGQGRMPSRIKPEAIKGSTTPDERKGIEDNPNTHIIRYADSEEPMEISPDDSLLFYYAGHGKAGEFDQGPSGYLLPSDAKPSKAALQNKSLVPMDDLLTALQDAGCKHTLLILDCCFAGKFRYAVKKSRDTVQLELRPLYAERFERYKRKAAWQVLVSAGPDQTAADWMGDRADQTVATADGNKPHSPFALALFEALAGKAEVKPAGRGLGDGVLTASELKLYLYDQVEKKTQADAEFKAQYPDLFPMQGHLGGEFMFFDPNNPLNFPERKTRNPYKGLKAYDPEDADVFFGRKASVDAAFGYLKKGAVAMVISAPSGLGKSSFARAGLYPKLKNELRFEDLLQMRPGESPGTALDKLKKQVDPHKKQVLLIDQYEELFTVCTDESQRQDFESGLMQIFDDASKDKNKTRILITVRSDYEWRLENSELGKKLLESQGSHPALFRLAPMNLDQLREALVNPALMEAFEFESPQLVDRILQEISFAPGALPLLSLAMKWLFQGVQKIREETDADVRVFTTKHYEQLGGINQCLSKMADAVYEQFDEAHRDMMRNTLLRMVQLQESGLVRRRVYINPFTASQQETATHELDYPNDDQDRICRQVLKALEGSIPGDKLEGINLLLRGTDENGREYVEPAHDSLINFWPTCLEWIDEFGKEQLILQRELWRAVEESMQAKTGEAQETDINTNTSPFDEHRLWETNPKLFQVIESLLVIFIQTIFGEKVNPIPGIIREIEPKPDGEGYKQLWAILKEWLGGGEIPALDKIHPNPKVKKLTEYMIRAEESRLTKTIRHISYDLANEDQFIYQGLIDKWILNGELPNLDAFIICGASSQLMDMLLNTDRHWLNQEEAKFIKKSWEKRIQDILTLKRERDEAQKALEELQKRTQDVVNLKLDDIRKYIGQTPAQYKEAIETYENVKQLGILPDEVTKAGEEIVQSMLKKACDLAINSQDYEQAFYHQSEAEKLHLLEEETSLNRKGVFLEMLDRLNKQQFAKFNKIPGTTGSPGNIDNFSFFLNLIKPRFPCVAAAYETFRYPESASFSLDAASGLNKIYEDFPHINKAYDPFLKDGKIIFTLDIDHTVKTNYQWLKGNQAHHQIAENYVRNVAFGIERSPLKKVVQQTIDGQEKNYYLSNGKFGGGLFLYTLNNESFRNVTPDGKYILTIGSEDLKYKLWDLETGKLMRSLEKISETFNSDSKNFLIRQTADKVEKPSQLPNNVVNFDSSGHKLLILSGPDSIRLWDVEKEEPINEIRLKGQDHLVQMAIFSPDDKFIFTGSTAYPGKLWEIGKEDSVREFSPHDRTSRGIYSPSFSRDGKWLLAAENNPDFGVGNDFNAVLWNVNDLEKKQIFPGNGSGDPRKGHRKRVHQAVFSPDEEFILTCSLDHTAKLWNRAGEVVHTYSKKGYTGDPVSNIMRSAVFSPGGKYILTSGDLPKLWNRDSEEFVRSPEESAGISHALFSPTGRFIIGLGNGSPITKVWLNPYPEE